MARPVSGTNVITRSAEDGILISSQSGFTGSPAEARLPALSMRFRLCSPLWADRYELGFNLAAAPRPRGGWRTGWCVGP